MPRIYVTLFHRFPLNADTPKQVVGYSEDLDHNSKGVPRFSLKNPFWETLGAEAAKSPPLPLPCEIGPPPPPNTMAPPPLPPDLQPPAPVQRSSMLPCRQFRPSILLPPASILSAAVLPLVLGPCAPAGCLLCEARAYCRLDRSGICCHHLDLMGTCRHLQHKFWVCLPCCLQCKFVRPPRCLQHKFVRPPHYLQHKFVRLRHCPQRKFMRQCHCLQHKFRVCLWCRF
jgi:hypothetical protein